MSVVANVAINVDSRDATQKLRAIQGQAKQTEKAFGGLTAAVGKLAAAFAAVQTVKFVFAQAAEIESQRRSLQVLTGSVQQASKIIKELQDLGAVTPFTSTELIDSAKRLQAFGVEANKVVETTRRLADVSGATGAELQGLVTAYGQVQAKGRLQGEELLQFQERGVALQQILKEEYKLSGDEFQKALEGGRISAQAVEVAIQKLTDAGGKYANGAIAQSDTLNGKLSTLQDSFQRLAQNIGTFFAPVFKFLIDGINAFIERVNNAARIGAEARAYEEANRRTRTRFGALRYANPFDQEVQQYRERLRKSLVQSELGAGAVPAAPSTGAGALPALLDARGGESEKDKKKAKDKAAEEEKRLQARIRGLQIETEGTKQLALIKGKIAEAEIFGNNELAIRLRGEERNQQILIEYQKSLEDVTDEREQQALLVRTLADIEAAGIETAIDLEKERLRVIKDQNAEFFKRASFQPKDKMPEGAGAFDPGLPDLRVSAAEQQMTLFRQELEELTNPINAAVNGANAIGDAFGKAFQGVLDGSQTAQEALANAFDQIGKAFIEMATQIIAKQIAMIAFQALLKAFGGGSSFGFSGEGPFSMPSGGGFAGGFNMPSLMAEGGFVTAPTSAIVGEGGEPEYVIPASKMRAAMGRYAGGARGAAVIPGNGESGGGYGGGAGGGAIDVRYSIERINNVDYVTAEQFERGMTQAAQQGAVQGERRALRTLGNSPATRRRLGV